MRGANPSPNPPVPSGLIWESPLNYRHHFHAGNFADVMKHAILLALIDALRAAGPVRVVETHAGAGLYDLHGEAAVRSSEAEGGVARLMEAPPPPVALEALRQAVRRENPDGTLRFYPGSPILALDAVGRGGGYRGYELRPDDFDSLQTLLKARRPKAGSSVSKLRSLHPTVGAPVQVEQADGYAALPGVLTGGELVLIDPPFERSDDYDRAAEAVGLCIARRAAVAVWVPIKDLETLDAFVRRVEELRPASLVLAQVRLRRLTNPMKMNGSAMVLVDTPDIEAEARAVCEWVARVCGEVGGRGEVYSLTG